MMARTSPPAATAGGAPVCQHWHCPRRQFFGTGTAFGPVLDGAQAEYVRVPFADTTMTRLPAGIDPSAALLIGDNLATGWVAMQRGGVRPGDVVAIVGGGPVGQLTSLAAQVHVRAAAVVLSDPVAGRRDLAAAQGALAAEPGTLRGIVDQARRDGRGADSSSKRSAARGASTRPWTLFGRRGHRQCQRPHPAVVGIHIARSSRYGIFARLSSYCLPISVSN